MMYRIACKNCGWHTKPHRYITDCVKEKEHAHNIIQNLPSGRMAHDAAFSKKCPKCLSESCYDERRWFSDDEMR